MTLTVLISVTFASVPWEAVAALDLPLPEKNRMWLVLCCQQQGPGPSQVTGINCSAGSRGAQFVMVEMTVGMCSAKLRCHQRAT